MKNSVRILGRIILTVIYCFAISAVTVSSERFDNSNHQTAEQEQYLAIVSNNIFCHIAASENSVNSFAHFSSPSFENSFEKLRSITKSIEYIFEAKFTQYFGLSINFLIQHRKNDIIFPFHYFW